MSHILRFDMWDYDVKSGKPDLHPQKVFEADGLNVIRAESVPLGDCWFIEVESLPDPLPEYYTPVDWKFSIPGKKFICGL